MALPLFQEKRLSKRRQVSGLLKGRLQTTDGKDISCRTKDVSRDGLGIVSQDFLRQGDIVTLTMKDHVVELEVVWTRQGFGRRDMYQYGLSTRSPADDLEKIFEECDCFLSE